MRLWTASQIYKMESSSLCFNHFKSNPALDTACSYWMSSSGKNERRVWPITLGTWWTASCDVVFQSENKRDLSDCAIIQGSRPPGLCFGGRGLMYQDAVIFISTPSTHHLMNRVCWAVLWLSCSKLVALITVTSDFFQISRHVLFHGFQRYTVLYRLCQVCHSQCQTTFDLMAGSLPSTCHTFLRKGHGWYLKLAACYNIITSLLIMGFKKMMKWHNNTGRTYVLLILMSCILFPVRWM